MKDTCEEVTEDRKIRSHTDEIRARNHNLIDVWRTECPLFLEWICSFSRFGGNPIDAAVLTSEMAKDGRQIVRATFFTEKYAYHICAYLPYMTLEKGDSGHLGCTVTCRKSRAGEDWARGSDLADGNYDQTTWLRIMTDIIGHELVRLGK